MIIYADFEYDNDSEVPSERTYTDVIQLGFVVCDDDGNEIERLEYDVKSQHFPIEERISNLTGITLEQNAKAPNLEWVLNKLSDYINKASAIYIYGSADIMSLRKNRNYLSGNSRKLLNALVNKLKYYEYKRRGFTFGLSNLCEALGISRQGEHSALADALHLKEVVEQLENHQEKLEELDPYVNYRLAYGNVRSALKNVDRKMLLEIIDVLERGEAALSYGEWKERYSKN